MKNKIVLFNIIIIAISLLLVFFFGISVNKNTLSAEAGKNVVDITRIYAANYVSPEQTVKGVPEDIRVSVIDAEGKVISDSENVDVDKLGNHSDREEIIAAFQGEPKVVTRYSQSLGKDLVYYALKVTTGDTFVFIRVSVAVESVNSYVVSNIVTMIFVLIVALTLSVIFSVIAANGLMKPLTEIRNNLASVRNGTYKEIVPSSGDQEINSMLVEINGISEKLQDSIFEARSDKEKLDYILSNISDGIVVLEKNGNISLINKNAARIFDASDFTGKNYLLLSRDRAFTEGVSSALEGRKDSVFEMKFTDEAYYSVSVRALERGLTVIVLSDITAVRNSEKMRSEFFANASHELKTPLTAIKGFNDIVSMTATQPDIKELSGRIDKEVARIINLINDMLDLSMLESEKEPKKEEVELSDVVKDIQGSLEILAKERGVSVKASGKGVVMMEREHAVELVKNLTENAIRYNEKGGHVEVDVSEDDKKVVLTVKDDGIGIEEEHLQRIFERFYRVNKSRSRETGGTGLGLSIVKHIAVLYGADVNISSTFGVGTTVTVTFPKN